MAIQRKPNSKKSAKRGTITVRLRIYHNLTVYFSFRFGKTSKPLVRFPEDCKSFRFMMLQTALSPTRKIISSNTLEQGCLKVHAFTSVEKISRHLCGRNRILDLKCVTELSMYQKVLHPDTLMPWMQDQWRRIYGYTRPLCRPII